MENEVQKGEKRKMIPVPNKEDIEKGKILHDKIKSHQFRFEPQLYLLEEYDELIEDIQRLFSRYDEECFDKETWKTTYKYHRVEFEKRTDKYGEYMHTIDIWSNPTIALINEAMHDYCGIMMYLKCNWENDFYRKHYLPKYIEMTETLLQLLHKLIDGEIVSECSFPKKQMHFKKENDYTHYKYARNGKYNNEWTLESEL